MGGLLTLTNNQMSAFKNKIKQIRQVTTKVNLDEQNTMHKGSHPHHCSATELRIQGCSKSPRSDLVIHEPILVCKKKDKNKQEAYGLRKGNQIKKTIKKVQPFVPVQIPKSPPSASSRKTKFDKFCDTQASTPALNKQIQIHIDKDDANSKACLKKLFKKIHKLSQDLAESQKERIRLELQLNNLKDVDGLNRGQEKDLIKLQGDNYKLKAELQLLKNQLRDKNKQLLEAKNKIPNSIVKEVVVQKPVEVRVEVPKYVPGPEKIIEVPKYIESQTMKEQLLKLNRTITHLEDQLSRQRQKNIKRDNEISVPAIVEKPIYLEKPVFVEKPIYVDRPYQVTKEKVVQVPIQVPYEVPVYVEKPVLDDEVLKKITELENEVQMLIKQNQQLKIDNENLRVMLNGFHNVIETLKRHNFSKNHQIESLLLNLGDYDPLKAQSTLQKQTKIYRGKRNDVYSDFQTFQNHSKRY